MIEVHRHHRFFGPSMCVLCCHQEESMDYLFLECDFAHSLWGWLETLFRISLDFTVSLHHTLLNIMQFSFSSQLSAL